MIAAPQYRYSEALLPAHEAVRAIACSFCAAVAGQECRRAREGALSPVPVTWHHKARIDAARVV